MDLLVLKVELVVNKLNINTFRYINYIYTCDEEIV